MEKIIRYWNQNRKRLIVIIAIIAFAIILIQTTNGILKQRKQVQQNIPKQEVIQSKPIQSTLTGQTVSEKKTDENVAIIQKFIDTCNNKKYEEAYALLTTASQKEYGNVETFTKNYCQKVFTNSKTYKLELWIATSGLYTYRIKYYDNNMLATGSSNMDNNIEDYITIVEEENKININSLIWVEELEKSQKANNIEVILNSRKVYKNYESYTVTIRNRSTKTIMISTGKSDGEISLLDKNGVEYPSLLHEIAEEKLSLKPGYEKKITIRFNKMYDLYRITRGIKFNSIILDQEEYLQNSKDENIKKMSVAIGI